MNKKKKKKNILYYSLAAHVSNSTRWALRISGGRSWHVRTQQRQADEAKASSIFGSLQQQLLGCEYLIWSGFQAFFSSEPGLNLREILKQR